MGVELVCFCYITSEGIEPTRRLDLFKKAGPFQEGWTFSRRLDLFKKAGPFQTVGFRRKNFGKVKTWKVKTRI